MYIQSLTIENVKSISKPTKFTFERGVNYLVGNNNAGKSSVFEALMFLVGGRYDPAALFTKDTSEATHVVAVLAGENLKSILETPKFTKFLPYLIEEGNSSYILKVKRSNKHETVVQNDKAIELDEKKIQLWSEERDRWENPTGIDALFKALVDIEPIWADIQPSDATDISATKVLGKLINREAEHFYEKDIWKKFIGIYKEAFEGHDESLAKISQVIIGQIATLVSEQYGTASARLEYRVPDANTFVKEATLQVTDSFNETPIGDKGTGMQRAFALAALQLWSQKENSKSSAEIPLILLIDEPETWLHPLAQIKLAQAISKIAVAQGQQIFIITHSPYMLQSFKPECDRLHVMERKEDELSVMAHHEISHVGNRVPTLAEITYRAFGLATVDLHNELFGYITEKYVVNKYGQGVRNVDRYLSENGITLSHEYSWNGKKNNCTLPYYVRNQIDHPDNKENERFSPAELEESVRLMVELIEKQKDSLDTGDTLEPLE